MILSLYLLFTPVPLPLGIYMRATMLISTGLSSNIEAILGQQVSDGLSRRAARYTLLFTLTPLQQFLPLFALFSILTTFALMERLITAYKFSVR